SRLSDWWRLCARRDRLAPTREPPSRRAGVDPGDHPKMLADVVQDVDERIAHLAWRPQESGVIAIRPEAPTPTQRAIGGLRHTHGQPAQTTLEVRRPVRFHQQMQMIGLDTELENAE